MKRIQLSKSDGAGAGIDLSPLLDCVFLLLIFFVVAAVLDPTAGLNIERPVASNAETVPQDAIRVTADAHGNLTCDGHAVTHEDLAEEIALRLHGNAEGTVLIFVDGTLSTAELVTIVDKCREGGASRVAVATRKDD